MALALIATAVALPAAAQGFVGNSATGFTVQPLPGFEAPGISSGDFLLKSAISFGVAHDSNVLRTQSNEIQSYIFFVAPSFNLTRNGGNHIEEVSASFIGVRYAQSESNDFSGANVKASEAYLLSPSSRIIVKASLSDGYQQNISTNHDIQTNAAAPVHYQAFLGSFGYSKSWDNNGAGVTLTTSRQTFDDVKSVTGTTLDQTFRNETDFTLETFLNIQVAPRIQSNLTFSVGKSEVRDRSRDSDQWKFSDTTTFRLTSKTSIGFLAAVSEQEFYNNPQLPVSPLGQYEMSLKWSPIQLLTFTAKGGYHDLGVNFTSGILSGGIGRYGSLDASYLIWRNLQLTSSLSYEKQAVSGATQSDLSTFEGRAALTYEFSSNAGVSFLYTFQKFDSNSSQFTNYNDNVFQTSLNLRF